MWGGWGGYFYNLMAFTFRQIFCFFVQTTGEINITALLKLGEPGGPTALCTLYDEKLAPNIHARTRAYTHPRTHTREQQRSLYHRDKYRRHVEGAFLYREEANERWLRLLHTAAVSECQFCNRVILGGFCLGGKAVFSVVHLRKGHSWHAWFQPLRGWGCPKVSKREKKDKIKLKIQTKTPIQPVKSKKKNQQTLYISTNYCLLTRDQSKTFVWTQIHKCRRSVNRIYKGYLLVIYMKRSKWILWWWALETESLDQTRWFPGANPVRTHTHAHTRSHALQQLWTCQTSCNPEAN